MENPLGYSELHKLMVRVIDYTLQKKEETRKEVQQVMVGHVLESWKEEMIRIGRGPCRRSHRSTSGTAEKTGSKGADKNQ